LIWDVTAANVDNIRDIDTVRAPNSKGFIFHYCLPIKFGNLNFLFLFLIVPTIITPMIYVSVIVGVGFGHTN
jgi:hypothetical protein